MNNQTDDPRLVYLQEFKDTVQPHLDKAFAYEQEAVAYSKDALKTLTYLCGGALVALPTALALFKVEPHHSEKALIAAAFCLVAALVGVTLATGCAFFTMAKRSEASHFIANRQAIVTANRHYPPSDELNPAKASENQSNADKRNSTSNTWRFLGLALFWLSIALFIAGCLFGICAILY
jgi:hypothetical protein